MVDYIVLKYIVFWLCVVLLCNMIFGIIFLLSFFVIFKEFLFLIKCFLVKELKGEEKGIVSG